MLHTVILFLFVSLFSLSSWAEYYIVSPKTTATYSTPQAKPPEDQTSASRTPISVKKQITISKKHTATNRVHNCTPLK